MTKPFRWRWAQAILLSVPSLLLVVLGLWLHGTRPAELIANEAHFKLLPKPLAHSAKALKNATRQSVALQMVLLLKHSPGEKPAWWGNSVTPGFSDTPCFVGSGGQRRFISVYALNKATFGKRAGYYRIVTEFIIPDTPTFTQQSTLNASIEFWKDGKVVGEAPVSVPVAPQ